MSAQVDTSARPVYWGWIGWAGCDAIGRFILLTGSTVVFSRMLSPRDFGVSALVLTVVTVAAVFVGSPFEEALAQKRVLRRAYLEAALAASWLVGLVLLLVSIATAGLFAKIFDLPDMHVMLPVATLSIFASGYGDILTALARRTRRFNDISFASLGSHAIGITLALLTAYAGAGVWAFIFQRLFIVAARAILLQWRIRFVIKPRWSSSHLFDIGRFASFSFLDRLIDNLAYLAFNNLVALLYGLTALGYVNMAMRLIDPVRGAVIATGHNLAFSFFAVVSDDQQSLRHRVELVVSRSALLIAPAFVGAAVISPIVLPLVAGPGWEESIKITVLFAIGSAISIPARFIYTALSASARPSYSLISNAFSFAVMVAILVFATFLGPISIGLARLGADATQAMLAVFFTPRSSAWTSWDRIRLLSPAWLLAGAMGLVVVGGYQLLGDIGPLPTLVVIILLGVIVYLMLMALFARQHLRDLMATVRAKRTKATQQRTTR